MRKSPFKKADVSALVDKIMAENKAKYAGWSMNLPTNDDGSIVVTETVVTPTTPPSQAPQAGDEVFTKEDVAAAVEKARQQEKDKLYGKLTSFEQKLNDLAAAKNAEEEAKAAAEAQAALEAKRAAEAELSAKDLLAAREQEWQQQLAATQQTFEQKMAELQQAQEQEKAFLEKERAFASLQAYTQKRLTDEQDNIAPELLDFVTGNSQEEIDASIERVKAKSEAIAAQVQERIRQVPPPRGASVTGYAPVGPVELEGGTRTFSAEDIRNMDMSTYAKYRQQFGTSRNNGGGLFG